MESNGGGSRTRLARAMWGHSLLDQDSLATKADIKYSRLRAILGVSQDDEPTTDELRALAKAAGVPDRFALEGFQPLTDMPEQIEAVRRAVGTLAKRVRALEERPLGDITTEQRDFLLSWLRGQAPESPARRKPRRPRAADRREESA